VLSSIISVHNTIEVQHLLDAIRASKVLRIVSYFRRCLLPGITQQFCGFTFVVRHSVFSSVIMNLINI
jgi:hypothetical protein